MKEMVSGISTVPFNSRKGLNEAFKRDQREITAFAAPSISVEGVPGEYDFRKFLTPAFEGWRPVQSGSAAGTLVGSIAVTTNKDDWKNTVPAYVNGLFGLILKPADNSAWYTDLSNVQEGDPPPPITLTVDGTLPSRAIVTGQTTAKGISVRLTQATDKR